MFRGNSGYSICVIVLILFVIAPFSPARSGRYVENIPGGPEVIYQQHAESGVVCVTVSVSAGAVFEAPDTRGVTHLLEHLCFDGTERFTRQEISDWIDDVGGFLNAFTRKETTVYFLLVDRSHLEEAFEILSQMLLHSVFPSDEFEKEKKVVLEELRQAKDRPGERRSSIVERYLYRGSDLAEPVLGYPSTIAEISRDQVIDYYRKYYNPLRMRIIVTGGFDRVSARGWINDYFTTGKRDQAFVKAEAGGSRQHEKEKAKGEAGHSNNGYISSPRWSNEVTVRHENGLEPVLEILVPVPGVGEKGFAAAILLEKILSGDDSPLVKSLERYSLPEAEVYLEVHSDFSALRFQFDALSTTRSQVDDLISAISYLSSWRPSKGMVEATKVSFLAADAANREKYHFYIMLEGERIALFGDTYLSAVSEGVKITDEEDIVRVLKTYFDPICFNAVYIDQGHTTVLSGDSGPKPLTRVFGNGAVAASERRTDSEIAALHIMVRGRNCNEEGFYPGITVVLNAALENSVEGKQLSSKLRSLGGSLKWTDNPYVPMDDYYLNPSWSFLRLEAPSGNMNEAAALVSAHLPGSILTEDDLESAKHILRKELAVRSGSAYAALSAAVKRSLFGDHPYSRSVFPDPADLERTSLEQLNRFREKSICGSNLIVTLVSPSEPAEVLDSLEYLFSSMPAGKVSPCPAVEWPVVAGTRDEKSEKSGLYIGAGWRLDDPSIREKAAATVAAEILSRRMQLQIRETLGLAYSTGASVKYLENAIQVTASVATGIENLEKATDALKKEITGLFEDKASSEEIAIARNRIISRLARRTLSSIDQAFSMASDIFLWDGTSKSLLLEEVTDEDVHSTVGTHFSIDRMVIVRMIPSAEGDVKKSPPAGMMRR
ncbi:MAG: insulinase family protein [Candidatus Krumholzibacteriota bacterium]|nr:insulinase family protein [Candidatus Krumholzibacteriota bacterium]